MSNIKCIMNYKYPNKKRRISELNYLENKKTVKEKQTEDDENLEEDPIDLGLNMLGKKKDSKIERSNNHIYFYSEVNRDSIYEFGNLLKEIEEDNVILAMKMNIDPIPIYIHINSYGGCVFSAFNAVDMIRSCSVPVYSIVEGCAASAGTIMSVVCEKRFIRPTAYMLIHQLSAGCWGKMCEIEDEFENLTEFMDVIRNLYLKYTKIPKKELTELLKHDLWLNVEKCMKYKLVDEEWNQLT